MLTLGLDIGTTTISGVIMDKRNQKVLEARTIPNDSFIQTKQSWEKIQNPDRILEKASDLLNGLLTRHPQVESIGLTGQMHGIVYLNQDGRSVSPLYTWQYGGGADLLAKMQDESVHAGYGMMTYYYHQKLGMMPETAVTFCTIMDCFGMYLTGRKCPLMHISNAASMGLFDCEKGKFRTEQIAQLGMNLSMLPEVSDEYAVIGKYRDIPVKIAIGDNQASFLGAVGEQKETVLLNMGTGGQISMLADHYIKIPGIETRPLSKNRYILIGASLCGGRAYAVLEQFFRAYAAAIGSEDKMQYDVMETLARAGQKAMKDESEPDDMLQICTAFSGTRQNPAQRGSITGISESNFTPQQLTYGVLKGMAQELYDMYQQMLAAGCERAKSFIASGNGLRKNQVLREIFSEMFDAEMELSQYEEEAACGAASI